MVTDEAGVGVGVAFQIPGFEAIRELGRGGMGVVHLARQVSLDRTVAVKLLVDRAGPGAIARFRREAELMARVAHPDIVPIHDSGVDEAGRPYLVMEYVEGGDLARLFPAGEPVRPEEVRAIARPIARALAHLHRLGILHRDLKPGNILMAGGRAPKLADFGLAVLDDAVGDLTRAEVAMGSPGYVAPEQQYRLKVDERADQYAFAAVVYELLAGRKPLGPYGPPSRHNRAVGPEVDRVVLRALAEDRDGRYPTVDDFAEALDRALAAPAPEPAPAPAPARFRRPLPGWAWATSGTAAALALIGLAWALAGPARSAPGAGPGAGAGRDRAGPATVPAPAPAGRPGVFVNGIGIRLVPIPAGSFLMGTVETDPSAARDETPRHPVAIGRGFLLGETEVTVGQFRRFVDRSGYKTEAERDGRGGHRCDKGGRIERVPGTSWRLPVLDRKPPADDEPVVQVSHDDARAFCEWLSAEEGLAYRLPTEAEWEYACRAGTATRWSFGDAPEGLDASAWFVENAGSRVHPVGAKRPNPWGLFDMHGNAWEWCADWSGPYGAASATDPRGPSGGERRVVRGGSWDWGPKNQGTTRSAARLAIPPGLSYFTYGFRIALTPPRRDPPGTVAGRPESDRGGVGE